MMNIAFTTEHLREALHASLRTVRKSPMELMECVLVSGNGRKITVSATGPDADIEVELGESAEAFSFAVAGERLRHVVDRATGEKFKVTLHESHITYNGGNVRGRLSTLNPADFPKFSEPQGEPLFDAELNVGAAIPQVLWAAGTGAHLQPIMRGLNIIARQPSTIVLACAQAPFASITRHDDVEIEITKEGWVTIPTPSAAIISQVFGIAGLTVYQNRVIVEAAGYRASVPLIASSLGPNPIEKLAVVGREAVVGRDHFRSALRACAAMVDSKKLVAVGVRQEADKLIVSGSGAGGDMEDEVAVEGDCGINLNTNANTLIAALGACPGGSLTITAPADNTRPHKMSCGRWTTLFNPMRM